MTLELWILLKASAILTVGLIVARVARRASASVRHVILASTFGALLALPIVAVLAPAVVVPVRVADSRVSDAAPLARVLSMPDASVSAPRGLAVERSGRPSLTTGSLARLAWTAGGVLLMLHVAASMWFLRRLRCSGLHWTAGQVAARVLARDCARGDQLTVLLHEAVGGPLTCGLSRPAILLPPDAPDWAAADLRRAFVHELEHVRRGDWVVQLLARVICGIYWFHPLVWVAWRQLRLESERACDDAVVRDAAGTEYAEQLVTLAARMSHRSTPPLLAMASRSDLSVRVMAVLDRTQVRQRAGARVVASGVAVSALSVLLIAPVQAVAVASGNSPIVASQRGWAVSALDTSLVDAAGEGDLASVTTLVNGGADVDAVVPGDGTPLIAAARGGHTTVVRFLLDRNADPDRAVGGDGNPLIMASREGHAAIVKLLLDRGARIDEIVPEDENALIQASAAGHLDVVRLLVTRGADVYARAWTASPGGPSDGEWRTPLGVALKNGEAAVVRYLRSVGASD